MTSILKFIRACFRFIVWMVFFLIRAIGVLFVIAAFVTALVDGIRSLVESQVIITALGKWWTDVHAVSLNQFQFLVQEHLGLIWLWDNVLQWLLLQPAFAVLAGLGIVIYLIGKRSKTEREFVL